MRPLSRSESQTVRRTQPGLAAGAPGWGLLLSLLLLPAAAAAEPLYLEVQGCRPAGEESEFLQSCVKIGAGRRAGKVLGPGWVAPSGLAAAVLQHRSYGSLGDRVTVRVYGAGGRMEAAYPMGGAGEEFPIAWSAVPSRFLGWVEVDGRGGQLRVIDRQRQRLLLLGTSPLEQWPIFSPRGTRVLLPRSGPASAPEKGLPSQPRAPGEEVVTTVELFDLLVKGSRQVVLRAGEGEELTQLRWISGSTVSALRRKIGATKGKLVQASFQLRGRSSDGE